MLSYMCRLYYCNFHDTREIIEASVSFRSICILIMKLHSVLCMRSHTKKKNPFNLHNVNFTFYYRDFIKTKHIYCTIINSINYCFLDLIVFISRNWFLKLFEISLITLFPSIYEMQNFSIHKKLVVISLKKRSQFAAFFQFHYIL